MPCLCKPIGHVVCDVIKRMCVRRRAGRCVVARNGCIVQWVVSIKGEGTIVMNACVLETLVGSLTRIRVIAVITMPCSCKPIGHVVCDVIYCVCVISRTRVVARNGCIVQWVVSIEGEGT